MPASIEATTGSSVKLHSSSVRYLVSASSPSPNLFSKGTHTKHSTYSRNGHSNGQHRYKRLHSRLLPPPVHERNNFLRRLPKPKRFCQSRTFLSPYLVVLSTSIFPLNFFFPLSPSIIPISTQLTILTLYIVLHRPLASCIRLDPHVCSPGHHYLLRKCSSHRGTARLGAEIEEEG